MYQPGKFLKNLCMCFYCACKHYVPDEFNSCLQLITTLKLNSQCVQYQ